MAYLLRENKSFYTEVILSFGGQLEEKQVIIIKILCCHNRPKADGSYRGLKTNCGCYGP